MSVRMTFDISDETHVQVKLIPHGMRKKVLRLLVENLARLIKEDQVAVITKLITHQLTLEQAMGVEEKKDE